MAESVFLELVDKCVADARIRFITDRRDVVVGTRADSHPECAPDVTIRVHRPRVFGRVLTYGNLGLGEAYIDGDFEVESGTLEDFLTILLRNRLPEKVRRDPLLALKVIGIALVNAARGKAENVRAHYDLGDDLFESFLDPTMTYSCGYARTPNDSLEELQTNKLDRICRKLRLRPGDRLLDIGCGYAGLLIHAAEHYGVTGTGVTLSRQHCARGAVNVEKAGLADRIHIELKDFGAVTGTFDKVVSVGMLEHVSRRQYARYFRTLRDVLTPSGVGLVHAIGCNTFKNEHDPFIQKYVFPGSSQPRLSEIAGGLERNRLAILDVENIARHYGYTVRHWLKRFRENQSTLDPARYDRAFMRMWEYWLCCGIAAAIASDSAVYQVLFTKDYTAPIPLQRV